MGASISSREKILKCSLKLFSSKGYDAVGVQEIAESASITKPTLYHFFGSKRGLLNALLMRYWEGFYDKVSKASCFTIDLKTCLNQIAGIFTEFAKNNQEFYRMQLAMYFSPVESVPNQAVKEINYKLYEIIEDLFNKASKNYKNFTGRQKTLAATFIGMLNTYIGLSLNGYCELNNELINNALNQFLHGIFYEQLGK